MSVVNPQTPPIPPLPPLHVLRQRCIDDAGGTWRNNPAVGTQNKAAGVITEDNSYIFATAVGFVVILAVMLAYSSRREYRYTSDG